MIDLHNEVSKIETDVHKVASIRPAIDYLNKLRVCIKCRVTKPVTSFSHNHKVCDDCYPNIKAINRARRLLSTWRQDGIKITLEQYNEMLKRQNYRCAICRIPFNNAVRESKPCLDHDHQTMEARGILCSRCNTIIGFIEGAGQDRAQNILIQLKGYALNFREE